MKLIFNNTSHLIEECKKQNLVAQKQIFDTYYKKIMTICLRYMKDKETAFELMNQSFIRIFDKIHTYKSEINFEGWLYRVTVNTIIDELRKNKKYRQNFITTDEFAIYGQPEETEGTISDWWDEAMAISSETLFEMINELPPTTKIVFNLYAIDEFSHKEIATQLNISEGTSKWHLANARKILKEKILNILNQNAQDYEKRRK